MAPIEPGSLSLYIEGVNGGDIEAEKEYVIICQLYNGNPYANLTLQLGGDDLEINVIDVVNDGNDTLTSQLSATYKAVAEDNGKTLTCIAQQGIGVPSTLNESLTLAISSK